jgi:hypothetical protein
MVDKFYDISELAINLTVIDLLTYFWIPYVTLEIVSNIGSVNDKVKCLPKIIW